jgi:hypothetical protein
VSTLAPLVDVQVKSVLIATDFSPASEKPLRHAIAIAQLYEAMKRNSIWSMWSLRWGSQPVLRQGMPPRKQPG